MRQTQGKQSYEYTAIASVGLVNIPKRASKKCEHFAPSFNRSNDADE